MRSSRSRSSQPPSLAHAAAKEEGRGVEPPHHLHILLPDLKQAARPWCFVLCVSGGRRTAADRPERKTLFKCTISEFSVLGLTTLSISNTGGGLGVSTGAAKGSPRRPVPGGRRGLGVSGTGGGGELGVHTGGGLGVGVSTGGELCVSTGGGLGGVQC
jgi:hypothetical protein